MKNQIVSFATSALSVFAAMLIATLQPAVTWASALPDAVVNLQAGSLFGSTLDTTITNYLGCGIYCNAAGDHSPDVRVSGDGAGANSSASLTYFFEVVGPSFGVVVPIKIDGVASFRSTNGIASGGVALGLYNSPGTYIYQFRCENNVYLQNCPQQGGFHLNQQIPSGYIIAIRLVAGGAVIGAGPGTYFSDVDPTITIDPSFPDAGLYSIQTSSGIGAAAVPEPSTILLLGAGMLVLGTKVWRRKQQ